MESRGGVIYACTGSLLLTPLCCDGTHEVTPRVSALAGCDKLVSEPLVIENSCSRAKFHWGISFATGLKRYTDPVTKLRMKHMNHKVRIPKGLYPRRIEEKLTKKQVGGEWIIEREMTMISKDGEISKFPEYHSSKEEEPTEQPRSLNKYGFDEDEPIGYEASDKEVDSDLESTARSKPKCKKLKKPAKAIPDRTFRNCPFV
ncbi:hypothetical protein Tco_0642533 [Tanacetum coccineum]